jgi:hypothetical protein
MQTKSHQLFRTAGVISAATLAALATPQLAAANNSDAFPSFDSYVKISGQTASINGDGAAYQKRFAKNENIGAGIEEFYYGRDLNKSTAMSIEGRALGGTEDYLFHLNVTKSELGSIDVGYKQFRTFYDGVGGFFPQNSAWVPINQVRGSNGNLIYPGLSRDLSIDRGKFWAEMNFGKENMPKFKLRYTNETRFGQKDSTSWGDTDFTGQGYGVLNGGLTVGTGATATGVYTNAALRKFMPSYLDINERHQVIDGTVTHTIGSTTAEVGVVGDWTTKNNGRFVAIRPGETQTTNGLKTSTGVNLISAPAIGSLNWQTFANQSIQTNYDAQDTDTKGIHAKTTTELNDKLTVRFGAAYQDVSSDFGGYRETVANAPVLVTNVPLVINSARTTDTFAVQNLTGQNTVKEYTGTGAIDFKATEHFTASFGVKGQNEKADGNGAYDVIAASTANVPVYTSTHRIESSQTDEKSITPLLDLRYTGLQDLALYSTVSRKFGTGTEVTTNAFNPDSDSNSATITFPQTFHKDLTEDNSDYTIGANWRASSAFTLRAEPFLKVRSLHLKGYDTKSYTTPTVNPGNSLNDNYQLDSNDVGVKLTAIAKLGNAFTFTTRYIVQEGNKQVTGVVVPTTVGGVTFPQADSMNSTTHTIGETIDWNPTPQFYMQASGNLVLNVISTVYPLAGAVPAPTAVATKAATSSAAATPNATTGASTAVAVPANLIVQNSENNYVTLSLLAGMVVTKSDDIQVQYSFYTTDNFNPALAAFGMSYGASATESTVTLGLKHKFSKSMVGNAKVGYTDSHNDTTGGRTDFIGPLAYASLEYGF